jgi:hypothetical protein
MPLTEVRVAHDGQRELGGLERRLVEDGDGVSEQTTQEWLPGVLKTYADSRGEEEGRRCVGTEGEEARAVRFCRLW